MLLAVQQSVHVYMLNDYYKNIYGLVQLINVDEFICQTVFQKHRKIKLLLLSVNITRKIFKRFKSSQVTLFYFKLFINIKYGTRIS